MTKIFLFAVLVPLVVATPAYAYLDPGTGSMIIQALAAGAVGAAIFWRNIVNKAKQVFSRRGSSANISDQNSDLNAQ